MRGGDIVLLETNAFDPSDSRTHGRFGTLFLQINTLADQALSNLSRRVQRDNQIPHNGTTAVGSGKGVNFFLVKARSS